MMTVIACGIGQCRSGQSLPAGRQTRGQAWSSHPRRTRPSSGADAPRRDRRALTDNLEIRVERDELQIGDLRIQETRGAYDPQVGFSVGKDSSSTPTTSVLQAATSPPSGRRRRRSHQPSQLLPTGGSITANFSNGRASTNNAFLFVNPLYSSGLTIGSSSHSCAGCSTIRCGDELRSPQPRSRNHRNKFRQQTVSRRSCSDVEERYWSLVYADTEAQRVRQESRRARLSAAGSGQKVQAGLLTPVALTVGKRGSRGLRDQDLLQAEVLIVAAQNGLKRLLAGDPTAPIWSGRLAPLDRPRLAIRPPRSPRRCSRRSIVDPSSNVSTCKRSSSRSIASSRGLGNEAAGERVRQFRFDRSIRPGVPPDVRSRGWTLSDRPRTGSMNPAFGGYREAWDRSVRISFPHWTVASDVQMPIFNRTAHAQLAQVDVTAVSSRAR